MQSVNLISKCQFTSCQLWIYVLQQVYQGNVFDFKLDIAADHCQDDCFACVILSHGYEGHIKSSRNEDVSLEEMMETIKNCQSLAGKPKLFFVQVKYYLCFWKRLVSNKRYFKMSFRFNRNYNKSWTLITHSFTKTNKKLTVS